ncbi:MAG: PASTA domain-containing protein [Elusimicrobia bacterium]|nr:PASTA domain-containing protein [Elusimicrobiota bacterium]MDE2426370.1 PASTA domain-containing protein [Elusimicrobiota bacterium]
MSRWEVLLSGLALLGFAFVLSQWALGGLIHDRALRTVPDLKGRSISAALDLLGPMNLGLREMGSEFDSSVAIASILRQDPPAGTVVRERRIVKIVVSKGGETVLAPSIVGLPLRNGEMLLSQSQLGLGTVTESYSLRLDKGMILSQDPKEEASVERNALVNVAVSGGPPPAGLVLMPDFQRKMIDDARRWAAANNVRLSESEDASALFPYGTILSQSPDPDAPINADTKVSLTISGHQGGPEQGGGRRLRYQLAPGGSESLVRIVVSDRYGERELFNGLRRPGSVIDVPLGETKDARARIFVNGVLVEERDL